MVLVLASAFALTTTIESIGLALWLETDDGGFRRFFRPTEYCLFIHLHIYDLALTLHRSRIFGWGFTSGSNYQSYNYKQVVRLMNNSVNCTGCSKPFTPNNLPRISIRCFHTYCEYCLTMLHGKSLLNWACPMDHIPIQLGPAGLSEFPINKTILKIMGIQPPMPNIISLKT